MLKNKFIMKKIRNILILFMAVIITIGTYKNIRDSKAENIIELFAEIQDVNAKIEPKKIKIKAVQNKDETFNIELPKYVENNFVNTYQNNKGETIVVDKTSNQETINMIINKEEILTENILLKVEYDKKEVLQNSENIELYNKELSYNNDEIVVSGYMPLMSKLLVEDLDITTMQDLTLPNKEEKIVKGYSILINEAIPIENISISIKKPTTNSIGFYELKENNVLEKKNNVIENGKIKFETIELTKYVITENKVVEPIKKQEITNIETKNEITKNEINKNQIMQQTSTSANTGNQNGLQLQVGDYVNYAPKKTTATSHGLSQEKVSWRILNLNSDGTVDILGHRTWQTIALNGVEGYNTGVNVLNEICRALFSNQDLGITARSLKIEDIDKNNNITSAGQEAKKTYYDVPSVGFGQFKSYNSPINVPAGFWYFYNHQTTIGNSSELPIHTENISGIKTLPSGTRIGQWHYQIAIDNTNFKPKVKEVLLDTIGNQWIASRYATNMNAPYFGLRAILPSPRQGENKWTLRGEHLWSQGEGEKSHSYSVRPIITVPTNKIIPVKGGSHEIGTDNVKPVWKKISSTINKEADIVGVKKNAEIVFEGTDKYYYTNNLTSDHIKVFVNDVEVTSAVKKLEKVSNTDNQYKLSITNLNDKFGNLKIQIPGNTLFDTTGNGNDITNLEVGILEKNKIPTISYESCSKNSNTKEFTVELKIIFPNNDYQKIDETKMANETKIYINNIECGKVKSVVIKHADFWGTSILLTIGDIGENSGKAKIKVPARVFGGQTENYNEETMIDIPEIIDFVNPKWEYVTSNIDRTKEELIMKIKGTDKYYQGSTLTSNNIKVYVDNMEQPAITKNLVKGLEDATSVEYSLTLGNFKENSGKVKIEIAENTIKDTSENGNIATTLEEPNIVDFVKPKWEYVTSNVDANSRMIEIFIRGIEKYPDRELLQSKNDRYFIKVYLNGNSYIETYPILTKLGELNYKISIPNLPENTEKIAIEIPSGTLIDKNGNENNATLIEVPYTIDFIKPKWEYVTSSIDRSRNEVRLQIRGTDKNYQGNTLNASEIGRAHV